MGFGMNYKVTEDYGLVPVGEYECIITNGEIKQLQSGASKVAFTLTVRNDIRQPCADRVLFADIWRKKEPNENDEMVLGFNFAQLMGVAKAAQIPDGTNFESLADLIKALVGRTVRASVTHREYNGKPYAEVDAIRGLAPTQYPECRHVPKQRPQPQNPAYGGNAPRQNQGYAQRPSQQYAQSPYQQTTSAIGTPYRPPVPQQNTTQQNLGIGNLNEFEDILQDGQLPF